MLLSGLLLQFPVKSSLLSQFPPQLVFLALSAYLPDKAVAKPSCALGETCNFRAVGSCNTHGTADTAGSGSATTSAVSAAGTATAIAIDININPAVTFDTVVTNISGAGRCSARCARRQRRLCRRVQRRLR
jgi:hypothetical protein